MVRGGSGPTQDPLGDKFGYPGDPFGDKFGHPEDLFGELVGEGFPQGARPTRVEHAWNTHGTRVEHAWNPTRQLSGMWL